MKLLVATQLWTRLASAAVQPQSQSQPAKSVNLQQLKNLKVDYEDGIAVVQFNQENSKVYSLFIRL